MLLKHIKMLSNGDDDVQYSLNYSGAIRLRVFSLSSNCLIFDVLSAQLFSFNYALIVRGNFLLKFY